MDSFEIIFQPSVHKDLRRLPKTAIIRVGDYRIVYEVDAEARRVTIHYVRHRRDVYRAI